VSHGHPQHGRGITGGGFFVICVQMHFSPPSHFFFSVAGGVGVEISDGAFDVILSFFFFSSSGFGLISTTGGGVIVGLISMTVG
jgi:hypothetical protein